MKASGHIPATEKELAKILPPEIVEMYAALSLEVHRRLVSGS
jgi:hypothetical protein